MKFNVHGGRLFNSHYKISWNVFHYRIIPKSSSTVLQHLDPLTTIVFWKRNFIQIFHCWNISFSTEQNITKYTTLNDYFSFMLKWWKFCVTLFFTLNLTPPEILTFFSLGNAALDIYIALFKSNLDFFLHVKPWVWTYFSFPWK